MSRVFCLLMIPILICRVAPVSAADLRVLASIRPLALIAGEIGGQDVEVNVLLSAGQSPHDFSLKMSDRRKLSKADLVLWVGADMEPYLIKLLVNRPALAMASHAVSGKIDDEAEEVDRQHQGHGHRDEQHLWLDPRVGSAYVDQVVQQMSELRPHRGTEFQRRARDLKERINSLLPAADPAVVTERRYAVAHDAYANFVAAFHLPTPVVLSESAEMAPGVRSLIQAAAQLQAGDCLLVDVNHRRPWAVKFASDQNLRLVEVDIMGNSTEVSSYFRLLGNIKDSFWNCL